MTPNSSPRLADDVRSSISASDVGPSAQTVRVLYSYDYTHVDTGSPRALVSVVEGLPQQQFPTAFLAKGEGPLIDALRERGTTIIPGRAVPVTAKRPLAAFGAVRSKARLLSEFGIDLLHLNEPGWNYDLVLAAAWKRVPIILHVHNPVIIHGTNLDWKLADRAVFVSRTQMLATEHFERIESRSMVIYNAVDLDRFARGTSLRDALGLSLTDVVIGTVSQISHRKGIDIFLDAAAEIIPRHPNVVFLVAGPAGRGEQEYADRMKARGQEREFAGRVRFIGPRSDVPNVLATCDMFFIPTRAEPLGIAIIEAMAAGVPVVASRVGGIPEIISDPSLGTLVDTIDGPSFARAIEALLASPDARRDIGRAGAASLRGRFDPATISRQWRDLYHELVAPKRRTR